ncbi:DNA-binding regulatory protein, YebC/PmpR family [Desulfurobacterium pacificum]|jgi:YebC/PmpR family DNA-binding regulatory protein|uniref:Probable transcriptional regulatory protein SAMN06265339_0344 n=1 Tax=Desulfurobacterium pacificum TaxID=240166 RepID=A0ABY1NCI8_9BACT|nr:YebC/PmpR family DNA-binding transcriptional regulator [Desulfurobacterium pacificum]SMP06137.1 DNA-binding regulatory protein, YebC/PmpR family [Desulfurobacterium pacificum]
MAGHSKWANIRHRKAAQDAKRGKIYTKLAREITVAAREGGGDPETNPRLRAAIERARKFNMPKENIERAIKRGTGEIAGESYEEVTYEGYGPGGVAIIVKCLTDNRNRTASEVRHAFSKHGGNLGTSGCVSWMFERKGVITVSAEKYDEEEVMMAAIEAGADDVVKEEDKFVIYTEPSSLEEVRKGIVEAGIEIEEAKLDLIPTTTTKVEGETAEKVLKLLMALEDLDDVQEVYSNFDMPEEVLKNA